MPAKSRAQVGFIMEHPDKFGGKENALKEWVKPTKGEKLPDKVPKPAPPRRPQKAAKSMKGGR